MRSRAAALADWGALLGFLDADIARTIEGVARRLQPLMEQDPHPYQLGAGEPDGFAGIVRGGDLSRLLLSEWLLADEEPDEFLRRFVMAELGYLMPERREMRSSARVVVLAETGPDQVGSPRLVHLAGLAVLHRRAAADGAEVVLGLLAEEPRSWVAPDLASQLVAWRRGRDAGQTTAAKVHSWLSQLEPDDRCWVMGAEDAYAADPSLEAVRQVRRLGARELTWTAGGATRLDVHVDGRRITLEVPAQHQAAILLRTGGETIARGRRLETAAVPLRFPRFTGSVRRLLCRTERSDELVSIPLARPENSQVGSRRRYRFGGEVLAAGVAGRRTVALVHQAGTVRPVIIGRTHRAIDSISVNLDQLGLDRHSIDELVAKDLAPLLVGWGKLYVRFHRTWQSIESPNIVTDTGWTAIEPSPKADHFDQVRRSQRRSESEDTGDLDRVSRPELVGPEDAWAQPMEGGYRILQGNLVRGFAALEEDATILGLMVRSSDRENPFLVVRSAGQRLIRCVWPNHVQTLLGASGDVIDAALHPLEPLLVVQRHDGGLAAFSVPDGASLGRLEALEP